MDGYDPKRSGLLNGNGVGARSFKKPSSEIKLNDSWRIKREVPDYEEGHTYSEREILLMTEKILLQDKPPNIDPVWLPWPNYRVRLAREVYVSNGTPDPSIIQGMYWRSHPLGRKVSNEEERGERGFYRR